jgi:hypothetical protein
MPLPLLFVIFMRVRETSRVVVSEIPSAVEFWIVPPLFAVPDPVTVRPPLEPVLFSTMPLEAPLEAMLRNVMSLTPIVVFTTLSAIPEVVVITFPPVTLIVPPPVALKAPFVPVLSDMPPEKLIVAPVLLVRVMPVPVSVIAPLNVALPPVLLVISTESPEVLLMVPE